MDWGATLLRRDEVMEGLPRWFLDQSKRFSHGTKW